MEHPTRSQDGCGQKFSWITAAAYKRSGLDSARLPKSLAEVDPEAAKEVKHHLAVTDAEGELLPPERNPALQTQTSAQYRLKCEVCQRDLIGPRLACIHCPGGLECCLGCSEDGARLATAAPRHVAATHAFQIFFEDAAASTSSAVERRPAVERRLAPSQPPQPTRGEDEDGACRVM